MLQIGMSEMQLVDRILEGLAGGEISYAEAKRSLVLHVGMDEDEAEEVLSRGS